MPILLSLLLFCYLPATCSHPVESLVPGGVAIIELDPGDDHGYRHKDRPLLVTRIDGHPIALVGLPLSIKAGEHFIEKRDSGRVSRKYFEVALIIGGE